MPPHVKADGQTGWGRDRPPPMQHARRATVCNGGPTLFLCLSAFDGASVEPHLMLTKGAVCVHPLRWRDHRGSRVRTRSLFASTDRISAAEVDELRTYDVS